MKLNHCNRQMISLFLVLRIPYNRCSMLKHDHDLSEYLLLSNRCRIVFRKRKIYRLPKSLCIFNDFLTIFSHCIEKIQFIIDYKIIF